MSQAPLLSVIVPAYNVEKYLQHCIESIEAQTLTDREIIIVDDGSTDGTGELCDLLAQKYADVFVLHKENGGAASARNLGLENAKGRYLGFVDGDDYIEQDMYQCLYEAMEREACPVACCNWFRHVQDKEEVKIVQDAAGIPGYGIMDQKVFLTSLLLDTGMTYSACDKLFKRELFAHIRFPEGKRPSEDTNCVYRVLSLCEKVVHIGAAKYYYRLNLESVSQSKFRKEYISTFEYMKEIFEDVISKHPSLRQEAVYAVVQATTAVYARMVKDGMKKVCAKESRQMESFLRKNAKEILSNRYLSRNAKIGVMSINLKCYPLFLKLRNVYGKGK